MDKSKEYVEMCEKADKIQEMWMSRTPHYADVVVGKYNPTILIWCEMGSLSNNPNKDWIWLPRQDDLQAMLPRTEAYRLFNKLYAFGERTGNERSPEELTLKYVMKTLYDMTWDGTKWIKSPTPE